MKVGDYLRVPYLVTAQSVPLDDGTWVRHVEHPELPNCVADSDSITGALDLLEVRRIETVLDMLSEGRRPPVRSFLLGDTMSRQRVERAGLAARADPLWDREADSLVKR